MKVIQLVALGSGSLKCGVVDYARKLAAALGDHQADATIVDVGEWNGRGIDRLKQAMQGQEGAIVHIQYPTLNMGKTPWVALVPWIFRRSRVFMTLHEFEIFSLARKIYMLPYALFAERIICTNEREMSRVHAFYPFARKKTQLIPIAANTPDIADFPQERTGVVYFGQISEGKGIDAYLDAVRIIRETDTHLPCAIVGAVVDPETPILQRIQREKDAIGLQVFLNLPLDEVAQHLARNKVALLPFPDGVSDKRGTALACLEAGLDLITVHGASTPAWWRTSSIATVHAADAAHTVLGLHQGQIEGPLAEPDNQKIKAAALQERSWPQIAKRHAGLYGDA